VNSQTTLKQAWPSSKFGTRRMKKKNFEIPIRTGANLAQQQLWNQKNEIKGM
jgi:hypothetical protein